MQNRGSEWNKWNFHVHTKGTNKNDQFSSRTMDDFFEIFFKKACEEEIKAIGITDYFSIDKYKETIEYIQNIENKVDEEGNKKFTEEKIKFIKGIFIFPNVELRMLPSTDRGKLINIHCLFNPNYAEDLENDFFSNIENQDGYKMNRYGLIQYGKFLDNSITDDNIAYKKGIDNYVLDLKSLRKIVDKNINFRNNCLFAVSNSNNDGASGMQRHYDLFENENGSLDGLRKSIYKLSHFIFSNNKKDVKYFLGRKSEGKENYTEDIYKQDVAEIIRERGSLKPCITGCDSHKEDTLFDKFTWIKSDLSFEGLRQICFEPEQRVKYQNDKPDFKEDKEVVSSIKYYSSNNTFTNETIHLNPNLNVIIGGKSSGKSILLYSIAKTLLPDSSILKNENGKEKYDLKSTDEEFNFEIVTQSGITQKMFRAESENSVIPNIKYIPQNYLVKLAEPEVHKKGKSLNKIVRDLINEDIDSNTKYQQFIKNVKNNDIERNRLIDEYFKILDEIEKLKKELKTKSSKEVLEKNISSNEKKVEQLNKNAGLTDQELEEYKNIQKKLEDYNFKASNFKSDYTLIPESLNYINKSITELIEYKATFLNNLKTNNIKEYYEDKLKPFEDIVKSIAELITEIEVIKNNEGKNIFKNDKNILNTNLVSLKEEKAIIDKELEPFNKNKELKKQIEELNESINNDKKLLSDIKSLNEKIIKTETELKECQKDILNLYDKSYDEYIKIISELKDRTNQLEEKDGLKIEGVAQFNFEKFFKFMYEISDGRQASYKKYSILNSQKKSTDETDFSTIKSDIKNIFSDILNDMYVILSKVDKKQAIKFLLDDYFYDYWKITYKNDKLGEMSTGKASFVILMLIIGLSKSKSPILIDQPEDNLDNRSITSDLVRYLKNKKLERQIIVVTHNANIVVNADAENVIVANQKGQNDIESSSEYRFDYINGAIENTFLKNEKEKDLLKSMGIREHIADIVEGGKEAFILRERKYGFNKK